MMVRTRLLRAGAFGCLIVIGAGYALGPLFGAGAAYPWKAAALFTAVMAIAQRFVDGHPFAALGAANRVTIGRAMLVSLLMALAGEPRLPRAAATAVVVAAVAALLDGVDGWLARRSGMASAFGARFDMETDALLVLVLAILVWHYDKAGVWVLAGGLMRYAFAAAGWILPWMAGRLTPTFRGKAVAVAQSVGLIVALAPIVPQPLSAAIAGAALAALTWSFSVDVRRLWRQRDEGAW